MAPVLAPSLLLLATVAVADADRGPTPSARLTYERDPAATSCPNERELRDAVSARLGYDPFARAAANRVSVTLTRAGRGLDARVVATDGAGHTTGSRRLTSATDDCAELGSALALAISIAIDPLGLPAAPSPAPVVREAAPLPLPSERVAPPPLTVATSVGLHVALGATPGTLGAGTDLQVGVRRSSGSLALAGRIDPMIGSDGDAGGRVRATLVVAGLVPCFHLRRLAGCALGYAGVLRGTGSDVSVPRQASTFYAALGARLALAVPLGGIFALDVHLDGLGALTRTTLEIDGVSIWTTPPLSVVLGSGLLASF